MLSPSSSPPRSAANASSSSESSSSSHGDCNSSINKRNPGAPGSLNKNQDDVVISAETWFAGGRRVPFDPNHKKIMPHATFNTIQVFERVIQNNVPETSESCNRLWITFLPSFPDGSYGFAKVERYLAVQTQPSALQDKDDWTTVDCPRLYVEYVGQGDSEKPEEYTYNTMERADLVQAQWAAHGIQQTVIVACGYSSLVVLELLRRQQERQQHRQSSNRRHNVIPTTIPTTARILHVLCINGSFYADGQQVRSSTTLARLLQSRRLGHLSATLAQRSNWVLDVFLRPYTSRRRLLVLTHSRHHQHDPEHEKEPKQQQQEQPSSRPASSRRRRRRRCRNNSITTRELRETEKAIRRHEGTAAFLVQAAATLSGEEHEAWADRWDLSALYTEYAAAAGITFDIVCANSHPDEATTSWQQATAHAQMALVQERMGRYPGIFITTSLPGGGATSSGGHLLMPSQVPVVCQHIQSLVERARTTTRSSSSSSSSASCGTHPDVRSATSSSEPWFLPPVVPYGLAR